MEGTAPEAPRAARPAPRQLAAGERVEAVVTGLTDYGAFVVTREGHRGLIHISEVSDWYVDDVRNYFTVGETVTVEVIGREEGTGKYAFSTRRVGGKQPLRNDRPPAVLPGLPRSGQPAPWRRDGGTGARRGAGGGAADEELIVDFLQRRVGQLSDGDRRQLGRLLARHGALRVALALADAPRRFDSAPALLHWVGRRLQPARSRAVVRASRG